MAAYRNPEQGVESPKAGLRSRGPRSLMVEGPMRTLHKLVEGLVFAEGPRWRDGSLFISDMHGRRVLRLDDAGGYQVVATCEGATSGLGWLPDGRLLVVVMEARKVMRLEFDGRLVEHADLNQIATFHANDMIVASDGTAYVGNFGFSLFPLGEPRPAVLARVTPDGQVSAAADGLWFPNGLAITPDGATLIVAESAAFTLTAFDIGEDGGLSNRRLWASLGEGRAPDGLCLDEAGAAWLAVPHAKEFVRIREGGEVLETITVEDTALACVLGGDDRRTLFLLTSRELEPEKCLASPSACVFTTRVEVAGTGRP